MNRKMIYFSIFPSNGAPVEWYWQMKTEVLGKKPVPMPLFPTQIPHGLARDRNFCLFNNAHSDWSYERTANSKCFWDRYNAALPFRCEPNSDRAVPTAAVYSIIILFIVHYTGYTQKNGAVSMVNKGKPYHSFVYTLYMLEMSWNFASFRSLCWPIYEHCSVHSIWRCLWTVWRLQLSMLIALMPSFAFTCTNELVFIYLQSDKCTI